jgi:hypothetical protein
MTEDLESAMQQFKHYPQSNESLMRLIESWVNLHGECSLGTVEVELGISTSKQRKLSLEYRDRFPLLRYKKGFWSTRLIEKEEVVPVPPTSQDHLTGT